MTIAAVLGAGAMGTACSWILGQQPGADVRLWARNETFARHIQETRENSRLLPHVRLPESILISADSAAVLSNAEIVFLCVPTRGLRDALKATGEHIPLEALIVSTVKGIENDSLLRPSEIIQQMQGRRSVVVLGGPCHAEEITDRKPASIVAACSSLSDAERIQSLLSMDFLRVYASADQAGVELGGALKNVIAIAAGICDGLEFGDNAKAALLTRGLAEMVRFGDAMGIDPRTLYGLAGLGDLITTCNSPHSRNRSVGEALGRGQSLVSIQKSMSAVAEGVPTARSVHQIADQRELDLPIVTQVYQVLFEGKSPREATMELMQRPLKVE